MKIDIEALEKDPDVRIVEYKGKWILKLKTGDWDSSWWEVKAATKEKVINKAVTDFGELKKYIIKEEPMSEKIELPPIVVKVRAAVIDMMKKIEYTDDGHTYKLKATGDWLQGVSSVSSIVPKDWLASWGAKEMAKFLGFTDYEGDHDRAKEVLKMIKKMTKPTQLIELLAEAKGAHARKSKTAMIDGKAGHLWLETYVKAKIRGTELPVLPEGDLARPLKQFLAWEKKEVKYWILSEARVCYPAKKYAGTMDGLAMMANDTLAVIDYKFASHISEDYYLQTAGYQACFEAYGIQIDNRVIIRLPKTVTKEEYSVKKGKYEIVPNDIEVQWVKGVYEFDRDVFFAALPVKAWCNQFTKKPWSSSKPKVGKNTKTKKVVTL